MVPPEDLDFVFPFLVLDKQPLVFRNCMLKKPVSLLITKFFLLSPTACLKNATLLPSPIKALLPVNRRLQEECRFQEKYCTNAGGGNN